MGVAKPLQRCDQLRLGRAGNQPWCIAPLRRAIEQGRDLGPIGVDELQRQGGMAESRRC
jgi:hypothetical protein